jgi:hypothetical protein
MDTKLTLSIDKKVIEKAKQYARSKRVSLSKLIEAYLLSVTSEKEENKDISPLVKSLTGVIDLPADYDYKDDYSGHLKDKYK